MHSHERKRQLNRKPSRKRLVFAAVAAFYIFIGAVIWALGSLGFFLKSWTNVISITFTALAVLFTLFQWLLPFSSEVTVTRAMKDYKTLPHSVRGIKPSVDVSVNNLNLMDVHKEIEKNAVAFGASHGKGVLIIYAKEGQRGKSIIMVTNSLTRNKYWSSRIDKHTVNGHIVFAAIFSHLDSGDYTLFDDFYEHVESVMIIAGQITKVNW